jgi:hypothetical protein
MLTLFLIGSFELLGIHQMKILYMIFFIFIFMVDVKKRDDLLMIE